MSVSKRNFPMLFGDDVRPWHEHEPPFERVAGVLRDRGVARLCRGQAALAIVQWFTAGT
jgi:Xaa-Pro dipeptidase